MNGSIGRTAVSLAALIIAGAVPAYAADQPPPAADPTDSSATGTTRPADQVAETEDTNSTAVGEVVVTAQRREESLSRVGITVAVVGADQLLTRGVRDPADLVKLVPGFQASTTYGGNPVYTLRGVGFNTRNASSTAPVGIYLDEAAVAYPYMSTGLLFDLQRVEVLKGPQGTLYGRNATGGLINYIQAKPTDTFQSGMSFDLGNYQTINANGFVSGPITDGLRARVAFNMLTRGQGYQRSITSGERLGELYQKALRVTLDNGTESRLSISLTGNYWQKEGDTPGTQAVGYVPDLPTSLLPGGVNPLAAFANPLARASIQTNPNDNRDVDFFSRTRQPQADIGIRFPGPLTDSQFWSVVGKLGYEFSDTVRVQSLTSYQDLRQRDVSDAGGVQIATLSVDSRNRIKSFAQELRLIGESDRFNWSIGGYYADDTIDGREFAYNDENATIRRFRVISTALPSIYTIPQRLRSFGNFRNTAETDTQVYAGFANVDYKLSDLIKFTLGGRYTKDKTDFASCTRDTNGGSLAFINTVYRLFGVTAQLNANECYTLNRAGNNFIRTPTPREINQNNFAWRGNVDITPNDTTLFYASVSRGYKSGGFPVLAASNDAQFDPILQERLTAFEGGAKLSLFDRSVQLNLAGFYYKYRNRQVFGRVNDLIFGTLVRIRNVPRSRLYGAEGELTWRLTPEITFRAAGTYLNSKIQEYTDFTELGVVTNIAGQPFTYTPKYSGTAGLAYDGPVGDTVNLIGDFNVSHQSSTQADAAGLDLFRIDKYTLFDGSVGLRAQDNSWRVSLYGTNLFDKYYWVGVASGTETIFRFPGMPRTYGIRTAFRF